MYQGFVHLHNLLRWVILVLAVIAIYRSLTGMLSGKAYTKGDQKTGLFLKIAADTTFLIGLMQWLFGDWGLKAIRNLGMGEVMKNSIYRYWAVEHFAGMLIAIILINIANGVGKKNITDKAKHSRKFWLYLVALAIILFTIPWPSREGIGRPLVPGMSKPSTGNYNGPNVSP